MPGAGDGAWHRFIRDPENGTYSSAARCRVVEPNSKRRQTASALYRPAGCLFFDTHAASARFEVDLVRRRLFTLCLFLGGCGGNDCRRLLWHRRGSYSSLERGSSSPSRHIAELQEVSTHWARWCAFLCIRTNRRRRCRAGGRRVWPSADLRFSFGVNADPARQRSRE